MRFNQMHKTQWNNLMHVNEIYPFTCRKFIYNAKYVRSLAMHLHMYICTRKIKVRVYVYSKNNRHTKEHIQNIIRLIGPLCTRCYLPKTDASRLRTSTSHIYYYCSKCICPIEQEYPYKIAIKLYGIKLRTYVHI